MFVHVKLIIELGHMQLIESMNSSVKLDVLSNYAMSRSSPIRWKSGQIHQWRVWRGVSPISRSTFHSGEISRSISDAQFDSLACCVSTIKLVLFLDHSYQWLKSAIMETGEEENDWQLSSSASVIWKVVRVRSFLFPCLSSAITSFERMFFLLLFQVAVSLRPGCVSCGTNWKKYVIGDQAVCLKDTRV